VALTEVRITDPLPGIILTGGPINLLVGESNSTTFAGSYVLTQEDIIAGSLTNQATIYGTSPTGVIVTDLSDDDSELEDDPTVIVIEGCTMKAFNAVSPDGDGLNDFFLIQGIECYPNNTVEIYNRWGIRVFGVDGYDNKNNVFRGLSEGRATVSKSEGFGAVHTSI
jgi:gliding motility-associated-like protein